MIATALADVQSSKAAWTRPDLTRAINDALPDHLGLTDSAKIAELLDQLTTEALELAVALDAERPAERVLPDELRLENGRSAYEAPGARLYATPEHIHTERLLAHAAADRQRPRSTTPPRGGSSTSCATLGVELGADQAAAVRGILTSGAPSSRSSDRRAPASPSSSVCSPRPGKTQPCGTASSGESSGWRRARSPPTCLPTKGWPRATSPAGWPPSSASPTGTAVR